MDEEQKTKAEKDSEMVGEDLVKGLGAAADVLVHGVAGAATGIAEGVDAVHDGGKEHPDR
jgi:hypothetical protein